MFSIDSFVLDSGPMVIWEGPNIVSHVVRRQHDIILYRLMTLEALTGPPTVVSHVVRRQHDIMLYRLMTLGGAVWAAQCRMTCRTRSQSRI